MHRGVTKMGVGMGISVVVGAEGSVVGLVEAIIVVLSLVGRKMLTMAWTVPLLYLFGVS